MIGPGKYSGLTGLALMGVIILLTACGTSVERIDAEDTPDLSGRWNATDSRLVAEEMVQDMLSRQWLDNHRNRTGEQPTIIVGEIRNLSHEHINTDTFINDIERQVINSGAVGFVAGDELRRAIREERRDQDIHALEETRNPMGREIGADYMLTGTINTITDVEGRTEAVYYQVNLALTSIADNRRVWVGQKEIQKVIQRGRFRS